jgi:hypothetical protein
MKKSLLLSMLMSLSLFARADSPLTYTNFYKAYLDIPLVLNATQSKGVMTKDMLEYLTKDANPIDIKLAIINAIGWDHKNKNSSTFLNYVIKKKRYKSEFGYNNYNILNYYGTPEEQIYYAYLRALENFFDINSAFQMSESAVRKSKSYSVNMIHLLIKAQGLFDLNESCYAAKNFFVLKNKIGFVSDMRFDADKFVFEYMNGLGADCK